MSTSYACHRVFATFTSFIHMPLENMLSPNNTSQGAAQMKAESQRKVSGASAEITA